MDHSKAIDKIRKCLALSKSANPNEAANALRQAQALMRQHRIDDTDLALADVGEAFVPSPMQTLVIWVANLARLIAEAFGCELYTVTRYVPMLTEHGQVKRRREFSFIGVGAAAEVAAYAFTVLSRQCAKARLAHIAAQPKNCKPITKTARGDEFARCWVIGASDKVQALSGSEGHAELLAAYLQRKHPGQGQAKAVNRSKGRNVRDDSSSQGYRAGKAARLDRAVGAAAPVTQIGIAV